ncbi:DinB family protein [Actinomadura sp. DC4]|uniref:DinB family protein n=1 Tax=Actinomadura sp. DC4 TaxID=3055069 RepID=UPI0025B13249|nr:DinB family protein [Actinomadura sp. DC4]MDN3354038.1 DinB family protein [Actinomadura sp. DC4]
MTGTRELLSTESATILTTLAQHRAFLRQTVRDLDDEQAARRTTVSALCLGGLIKHVANVERGWMDFVVRGTEGVQGERDWQAEFRMLEGETLAGLLEDYDAVAARTEEIVAGLPDLDFDHALPEAPWFTPGARWSARRVLLHILAETSQHAGHADIIRESLDGAKTMG